MNNNTIEYAFITGWIKDVKANRINKSDAIKNVSKMLECNFLTAMVRYSKVYESIN
jgi:hypothetical protein